MTEEKKPVKKEAPKDSCRLCKSRDNQNRGWCSVKKAHVRRRAELCDSFNRKSNNG
jgi:hypothetical protein